MNEKVLLDVIIQDIKELEKIASALSESATVMPVYTKLAQAKIKSLYVEFELLGKSTIELSKIEDLADLLPDKFEIERKPEPVPVVIAQEQSISEKALALKSGKHLTLKREQKFFAAQIKFAPIKNMKSEIGITDKILFINELFDKSIENYNKAIDILNQCTDIENALKYVDSNFNWDEENLTTSKFFKYIYRRFSM